MDVEEIREGIVKLNKWERKIRGHVLIIVLDGDIIIGDTFPEDV